MESIKSILFRVGSYYICSFNGAFGAESAQLSAKTEHFGSLIVLSDKLLGIGPIIIEGDGILPSATIQTFEQKDVCSIFIVEQNEKQLLNNLRSRGRGFNDGGKLEQEGFAHASWLYGQWLAQEARKLGLLVIDAQPQQTIFQRLLSSIGM